MKHVITIVVAAIIALGAIASSPAFAENKEADALFKKGKKLLDQKKYAEACESFEKSDKLDPSIGTKLNIAKCFEDWGKVATALKWYREAESAAKAANDDRTAKIHEHLEEVDSDTPRLTLRTAKDADTSVSVMLDGSPAKLDEALEVDPGAHVVEYMTESGEKKKKVIPVERGGSSEVKLDLPKKKAGGKGNGDKGNGDKGNGDKGNGNGDKGNGDKTPMPPVIVDDPGKTRRLIGYGLGGVGAFAVGISTYLTLSARGDYKDALASHCAGSTSSCDPTGLTITHDARKKANIATIVFVAGLAAIGGGVALFITAPKATTHKAGEEEEAPEAAFYLSPTVDEHGGGIVFGGRY